MQNIQPFSTIIERYKITDSEYRKLKDELIKLRKEFVQKTGVNYSKIDLKSLQNIEQKMYSIEHTLAHADVLYEHVEETRFKGTLKSLVTELRFTLMGLYLKYQQKIHPRKHGFTNHTTTYHLKR